MKCLVCNQNDAIIHPTFGALPCATCRENRKHNNLPNVQVEFTSQSIKDQRKEYAKSIIQPYRAGQLSREYLDIYGTKNIKPTAKEIKNAKPVWKDTFSSNMDLSKSK